jgi:hypothetical protein
MERNRVYLLREDYTEGCIFSWDGCIDIISPALENMR